MPRQFHVLPKTAPMGAHVLVQLDFEDGSSLRYRDARRFSFVGLIAQKKLAQHIWFQHLGPEPLDEDFNAEYLYQQCQSKKSPIKTVIMDAKVVVGVGNIYASEALYRAGIHPTRAANRISSKRSSHLMMVIKQIVSIANDAGGISSSDFVQPDGKPGYFGHSFQVYGREGQPCLHCNHKIKRITQAGRSTFYCGSCQR